MAQPLTPKLEARHYILLQAINRLGSMSAAADQLGVTPSAVTHRIREAERRLGIALTTRVGAQVQLTVSGQRLAQSADRALDELYRAELDAERIGKGAGSIVRLCMGTYSFFHWLPSFLRSLEAVDPSLQVEIIGETSREPLRLLHDDAVDVALVPGPLREERRITFVPMDLEDELICVTAASHPLAKRRFIEAEDLTAETHLTYSAMVTEGFEYDRFFRPAGRYPARLLPLAVPEAVQELVAANLGISILSKWAALPRLKRGEITGIKLTAKGLRLDWHVAFRQSDAPSSPSAICARALANWKM